MTADSLLASTAHGSRGRAGGWGDAQLSADLMAEVRLDAPGARSGRPVHRDLGSVERAFGRHFFDQRARSGVEAAQTRADRLGAAAGGMTESIGMTFASDVFVSLAVERPWRSRDIRQLLENIGDGLGLTPEQVSVQLLSGCLRTPQLFELPPLTALEIQLSVLVALSPAIEASLWLGQPGKAPTCLLSQGETATTRRFRIIAREILEGRQPERGLIIGAAVRRWQRPWAALVIRLRSRDVEALVEEAASAISPVAERDFLLERSAERERLLVSASERRLSRLGFDLHDGALQHLAALDADVHRVRAELPAHLEPTVDSLAEGVSELERVLRELAHSLEPASLLRRPLADVVEAEAASLRERTGIHVTTRVLGDFSAMTASQKIAVIRVVQEACANVREHSGAASVEILLTASRSCVDLQITDDGDGFEVARTLQDAAQRGRLGLVGGSERVRLLGGTFDVRSRVGGPTTVSVTVPRWQPLVAADEPGLQLAY